MALTRPFINNFPAFDATVGSTITLSILGGDAITGFSFKIFSDQSSTPIYSSGDIAVSGDTQSTNIRNFNFLLTTSMNLENNKNYTIQPTIFNASESQVGTGTIFTCYTTPTIELKSASTAANPGVYVNLVSGATLNSVSPLLQVDFSANDLNSIAQPNNLEVTIYGVKDDNSKDIVFASDTIYTFTHNTITNIYSATLTGHGLTINVDEEGNLLPQTNRVYKSFSFALKCTTVENMVISKISVEETNNNVTTTVLYDEISNINCYYSTISNSPNLIVTNLCNEGKVKIISTFTDIEGTSNPAVPTYIGNTEVDLTGTGHWAKWEKAFSVNAPYTVRLWARDLNEGQILTLTSESSPRKYITLSYRTEGTDSFISLEAGFNLTATQTVGGVQQTVDFSHPYYIESQRITTSTITSSTALFIGLQSQGGLYDLDFEIIP